MLSVPPIPTLRGIWVSFGVTLPKLSDLANVAKFEVCGHHYVDLSEFGFGAALLSDCKYGFACHENVMRMSLLRSSKKPDDTADMGDHQFKFAFYPHKVTTQMLPFQRSYTYRERSPKSIFHASAATSINL